MNKAALKRLQAGYILRQYKESGNSMTPIIKHRQPVMVGPVDTTLLEVGDIVVARVRGRIYCHLITAIDGSKDRVQIGNNHGRINGWTSLDRIYGIVVAVGLKARSGALEKVLHTHVKEECCIHGDYHVTPHRGCMLR